MAPVAAAGVGVDIDEGVKKPHFAKEEKPLSSVSIKKKSPKP